jgi:hypothetical protein
MTAQNYGGRPGPVLRKVEVAEPCARDTSAPDWLLAALVRSKSGTSSGLERFTALASPAYRGRELANRIRCAILACDVSLMQIKSALPGLASINLPCPSGKRA